MTQALPAATVLSHLGLAERRETINILSDLDQRERDLARDLLAAVPPDGRIAVASFVNDVRRRCRAQAIAEAESMPSGEAWKYAITLMDDDQRDQFRELAASGTELNAAAQAAMATSAAAPAKPRRRSVPRRRLASAAQGAQDADPPPAAAQAQAPAISRPTAREKRPERPFFVGGRSFGPHTDDRPYGQSVDYDTRAETFKPPWLLSDDAEDDELDEEETDDESRETHAAA